MPGVIADRFELERLAGKGGMGSVYRARDRVSGVPVALKLLAQHDGRAVARFDHEARVLSELGHPHIVRYVAHGVTPEGEPYLAMEWLEGEDLAERLERQRLRLDESVELARRVAEALGVAHARGVVHRDIKPSNLFLVNGEVEQVKVLDFGIARVMGGSRKFTRTGGVVGTPGYMAPEQARGEREKLDARADVFSLGCVLFECLTGRPAFEGAHFMALLAKLLLEDVPPVRELRPDVPMALDKLVARMLAKDPDARPSSGAVVTQVLESLTSRSASEGRVSSMLPPSSSGAITGSEQRLLSIVVAIPPPGVDIDPCADTLERGFARPVIDEIRSLALLLGASTDELVSGAVLVTLKGIGNVRDQAARAARCALRLRALLPDAAMALVTGRAESRGKRRVGPIVERAAALVETLTHAAPDPGCAPRPVRIDQVTQALLDARFEVRAEGSGHFALISEREVGEAARTLLGKPSPCVGREPELRTLRALLGASFDESVAQAVLVTGPAGVGKSRLLQELTRQKLEARPSTALAVGRGDSMSAGSAFSILGSAIRNAATITSGEPLASRRLKLLRLVRPYIGVKDRVRVAAFLGEMVGTPFPDDDEPRLRSARQSASIMAGQIARAYLDFMAALSDKFPTLLVLEDLHWGDAASINLVDQSLEELSDRPFVVLALARPEVHQIFPDPWSGRYVHHIRLGAIPRRAAEQLVRGALGAAIGVSDVSRILDHAQGNAFYLEELIRAFAEGRGDKLPETVLGMVEARLEALPSGARRVLRAASVFGQTFWKSGVVLLLGETDSSGDADEWLPWLVENELVTRRIESRFAGEEEYAFRHELLRAGSYAMLTERDRAGGHKLAADWLLGAGEHDAKVLAEHLAQGGEAERAAEHYLRAAEQALRGGDHLAAISIAEQGIVLGTEGDVAAGLRAIQADAALWKGDYLSALLAGEDAARMATPGSASECWGLGAVIVSAFFLCQHDAMEGPLARLLAVKPSDDAIPVLCWSFYMAILALASMGRREAHEAYLCRLDRLTEPLVGREPIVSGWASLSRAAWMRSAEDDPWSALLHGRVALMHFELAGDRRHVAYTRLYAGVDCALLGDFDRAEKTLQGVLDENPRGKVADLGMIHLARVLLARAAFAEAEELALSMTRAAEDSNDRLLRAEARLTIAAVHLARGELAEAEREAAKVGDEEAMMSMSCGLSRLCLLAEASLRRGRVEEAMSIAEEGIRWCDARARDLASYARLRLLRAEALIAMGDIESARRALTAAGVELLACAAKIGDAELRKSFLEDVPAHARTLELCRAWISPELSSVPA